MEDFQREWRVKVVVRSVAFLTGLSFFLCGVQPVSAQISPKSKVCYVVEGKSSTGNKGISRGRDESWSWPVDGVTSSDYGWRNGNFHHGLDVATPSGSLIRAARGGKVVKTGWLGVYGLIILLDHGNGVQTLYAHNSKILAKVGDLVEMGEGISISGSTGKSTGPHLHFEIRCNGKTINPEYYLPRTHIVTIINKNKPNFRI